MKSSLERIRDEFKSKITLKNAEISELRTQMRIAESELNCLYDARDIVVAEIDRLAKQQEKL